MHLLRLLEKGFVIFAFLFFTGAIVDLLNERNGLGPGATPHPVTRLASLLVQLGILLLLVIWRRNILQAVLSNWLLWPFVSLVLFSCLWSEVPGSTFRNSIFFLQITLFGVYLAVRFTLKEQLQLLAWSFSISMFLSILVCIFLPSYGVMGMGEILTPEAIAHQGAWRGIYIHKNPFGRMMALSSLIFLILQGSKYHRWLMYLGFMIAVTLTVLSTSKTALIILFSLVILVPLYKAWRWNYTLAIPLFILLVFMGGSLLLLVLTNAETIFDTLGRDMTLTGRTDLWALSLDKFWERPLLGYGFTGFWRRYSGESADILLDLRWEVPHSHNGLLDLLLDLGLVGLLLFLVSFLPTLLSAIIWIRRTKNLEGLWPLAYLSFLFLANLTESSLLRQNSLWFLYVAISVSLCQQPNRKMYEKANLESSRKSLLI